jgi:hypothetical protein
LVLLLLGLWHEHRVWDPFAGRMSMTAVNQG